MMRSTLSVKRAQICLVLLFCGSALLGGCSQSQVTDMWKDPSYNDGTMKKMLAVAVRKDPIGRRIWEDAFAEALRAHGVSATASYTMFPSDVPDSLQICEVARKGGYDGVAVSVRLPNTTEESYVAGYTKREPVTVSGPFLQGYTTYWKDVRVPGYTETDQVRRFQTTVSTLQNGGRLIWSETVETPDAAAYGPVRDVIRDQIVAHLVTAGIVPPKTK